MQKSTTFKCLFVYCRQGSARMNVSGHIQRIETIRRLPLRQVLRRSVRLVGKMILLFHARMGYCMLLPLVPCIVSPILCKQWLFPFPFIVSPGLPNHDDVRRPMHPCVSRLSAMARLACAIAGDMIRGRDGNLFFTCHRNWELVFTRSRAQEISNMDDSE